MVKPQLNIAEMEKRWLAYWEKEKVYKCYNGCYNNIHPGDLKGLPDDCFSHLILFFVGGLV